MNDRTYPRRTILTYIIVGLAAILISTTAFSQGSGSEVPSSLAMKEYVEVLNLGDREALRTYILEHYDPTFLKRAPIELHIGSHMEFYYSTGGLGYEFHAMADVQPASSTCILLNKLTDSWVTLRIPHSEDPPHQINNRLQLKVAAPPGDAPTSQKLSDQEMIERLERCMNKLLKDEEFSGAVIVAMNGKPLFSKAYGLASKSYSVPNQVDTKFNIASLGKMFTGVAIVQLAEQGKLSLEDPVSKYLSSEWIKPEIGQTIQVQHLLTHTSGFGSYFRQVYAQNSQMLFRELDDYKSLVADEIPAFKAGEKWSYSNTGMLLLGAIIEKITGSSYADYVRENIFLPAGMKNSDAYDNDIPVPNRATAYMKEYSDQGPQWKVPLFARIMKGSPSGGSFSTIEDLLKFDIALRENKLLSPKYTELVLTSKPEINSPFYGYGFFTSEGDAGRLAEHGGDGMGVNCQFRMYLDLGYTVAVLSNYSRPAANIVDKVIHQMLTPR